MSKILLAVDEDEAKNWFINTPLRELDRQSNMYLIPQSRFVKLEKECKEGFIQAKQDAKELIKQAKLELIDEILKEQYGAFRDLNGVVEVDDILAIKSEIEKE